jgi:predicted transcriptional regulator
MNPRSKWEIILDILKEISEEEGGAKKTRIMQKAYLDWKNFERHFCFLLEHGFVRNVVGPEEGKSYELTEKGEDLLMKLMEVEKML